MQTEVLRPKMEIHLAPKSTNTAFAAWWLLAAIVIGYTKRSARRGLLQGRQGFPHEGWQVENALAAATDK